MARHFIDLFDLRLLAALQKVDRHAVLLRRVAEAVLPDSVGPLAGRLLDQSGEFRFRLALTLILKPRMSTNSL